MPLSKVEKDLAGAEATTGGSGQRGDVRKLYASQARPSTFNEIIADKITSNYDVLNINSYSRKQDFCIR